MRVTDRAVFHAAQTGAGRASARHQAATEVAASGLKLQHPGQAPADASAAVLHGAEEARQDSLRTTTERAMGELDASDAALADLGNALVRARELAVQLANATYDAPQRAAAAAEVDGLLSVAVGVGNTQLGGRYLFGGDLSGAPPFDASGAYLGDAGVRELEVAPGVRIAASVRADVALSGVGGGTDLFATLRALSTALRANDPAAVAGTLTGLDASTTQLSEARATAGATANVLAEASSAARTRRDAATSAHSSVVDADLVDAASELALARRALEAALEASARSFEPTLLGKLGR